MFLGYIHVILGQKFTRMHSNAGKNLQNHEQKKRKNKDVGVPRNVYIYFLNHNITFSGCFENILGAFISVFPNVTYFPIF